MDVNGKESGGQSGIGKENVSHRVNTEKDRLRARSVHRRPGGGQEGRGDRAAQPLEASECPAGPARRDRPEEHHHDRPYGRRQDGDRPEAREAGQLAVSQDRGLEVHRSGLRGARCGLHDPRSHGDRRGHGEAGGDGERPGKGEGDGRGPRPRPAAAREARRDPQPRGGGGRGG